MLSCTSSQPWKDTVRSFTSSERWKGRLSAPFDSDLARQSLRMLGKVCVLKPQSSSGHPLLFPPFPHPPINIKQAGRVCTMLILNYLACAMLSCAQWLFGSAHIMTLLCWNKWLANFRISVNICVSEQPDPVTYPNEEMEIESHKGTKVSLSSLWDGQYRWWLGALEVREPWYVNRSHRTLIVPSTK